MGLAVLPVLRDDSCAFRPGPLAEQGVALSRETRTAPAAFQCTLRQCKRRRHQIDAPHQFVPVDRSGPAVDRVVAFGHAVQPDPVTPRHVRMITQGNQPVTGRSDLAIHLHHQWQQGAEEQALAHFAGHLLRPVARQGHQHECGRRIARPHALQRIADGFIA